MTEWVKGGLELEDQVPRYFNVYYSTSQIRKQRLREMD